MTDVSSLALAFFNGSLLGAFFFGGLWFTVQRGLDSDWPELWFLGSLFLRTGLVLVGFYFAAQGHWSSLVLCLLGFVIARYLLVSRLAQSPTQDHASREGPDVTP